MLLLSGMLTTFHASIDGTRCRFEFGVCFWLVGITLGFLNWSECVFGKRAIFGSNLVEDLLHAVVTVVFHVGHAVGGVASRVSYMRNY